MLSERCNLTPVANLLVQANPKTVLDVGVGFGNYGMIARAFLDVWPGRALKHMWQIKIDGVEYYKDFESPVYSFVYNQIYWGDIFDLFPKLPNYEAIIAMHIVEHFEKARALDLIQRLKCLCTKRLIIGTPSRFFKTGWEKYPKEEHKCLITSAEFEKMGFRIINFKALGIIAWKDL